MSGELIGKSTHDANIAKAERLIAIGKRLIGASAVLTIVNLVIIVVKVTHG